MRRIAIVLSFIIISLSASAQLNAWFVVQSAFDGGGILPCNAITTYGGGESFPTETTITLGSATGAVWLYFQAYNVPDRCTVEFDGAIVMDTGYRGNDMYQDELNSALDALVEPRHTIIDGGYFKEGFTKTTATTTAIVRVYAPLTETAWEFTLYCPQ